MNQMSVLIRLAVRNLPSLGVCAHHVRYLASKQVKKNLITFANYNVLQCHYYRDQFRYDEEQIIYYMQL